MRLRVSLAYTGPDGVIHIESGSTYIVRATAPFLNTVLVKNIDGSPVPWWGQSLPTRYLDHQLANGQWVRLEAE